MIKKRSVSIFVVAMILTSLISVCLLCFIKEEVSSISETVVVSVDGKAEKTLTVEQLSIYPGERRECIVFLKSELSGDYKATIDFEEKDNGGLKDFIDVEIYIGDEMVYNGNLIGLLSGRRVAFNLNLDNENTNQLKIVYIMDVNVGNNAQKTTASFYVKLKINT